MLKCPLCGNFIPVSLLDVTVFPEVECPTYGIKLILSNESYKYVSDLFDSKQNEKKYQINYFFMCWVTNSKLEAHFADCDTKVYKIVAKTSRKNMVNSLCRGYTYKIGKLFEMEERIIPGLVMSGANGKSYAIKEGFHSYATFAKAMMKFEEVITYDLNPSVHTLVIVECIIPEGSIYYINNEGEVVSDKIIISGFCNLG